MDIIPSLGFLLVYLLLVIFVFMAIRQLLLWYWRLNEIADSVIYIADHFRRIDQEQGRQRIAQTRQQTGAGSPFAPMGNRTS